MEPASRIFLYLFVSAVSCGVVSGDGTKFSIPSPWVWTCRDGLCTKEDVTNAPDGTTLETCKLICGPYGTLWPVPSGSTTLGSEVVPVLARNIVFNGFSTPSAEATAVLQEMISIFRGYVNAMEEYGGVSPSPSSTIVSVDVSCLSTDTRITYNTDESYTLTSSKGPDSVSVAILSETVFGARHALETLAQLITWDDTIGSLVLVGDASVVDRPFYPHRGLSVDISRNYIKLQDLYRSIDAMSYNKLNALHLHISDTHSFPFDSTSVPQMAPYGAYSARKTYTVEDFKALNDYANIRGVRIIPEIDGPAHAGNGWQWGEKYGLGELALCVNQFNRTGVCIGPPCGILNPINDNVYDILQAIYGDLKEALSPDVFHLGADEVKFGCWNSTQAIVDWLAEQGRGRTEEDFYYLWGVYQSRVLARVDEVFGQVPVIVWTSTLTEKNFVDGIITPERYIVQVWSGSDDASIATLYNKGYDLIFSNSDNWYLDCGYGSWVGDGNNWCSPYKGWQLVYDNDPIEILSRQGITADPKRIWGGEAAIWTEMTDGGTLDGKLWPRAAALAERLWSNPAGKWRTAEKRLVHQRERLSLRGIGADPVQPHWCHQNEGICYYD